MEGLGRAAGGAAERGSCNFGKPRATESGFDAERCLP
jgi:hypothetical protein